MSLIFPSYVFNSHNNFRQNFHGIFYNFMYNIRFSNGSIMKMCNKFSKIQKSKYKNQTFLEKAADVLSFSRWCVEFKSKNTRPKCYANSYGIVV